MKKIILVSAVIAVFSASLWFFLKGPVLHWEKGDRQMYEFRFKNIILTGTSMSPGVSRYDQIIRGTLNFRVFEVYPDLIKTGFQLSPVEVLSSGKRDPELKKIYGEPFFVEFDRSGKLSDFNYSSKISVHDEKLISNMVRSFQLVINSWHGKKWESEEEDGLGTCSALYESVEGKILKRKIRYTGIKGENPLAAGQTSVGIQESEAVFGISEKYSWVENIRLNEKLLIKDGSGRKNSSKVNSSVIVYLKLIPFIQSDDVALWDDDKDFDEAVSSAKKDPKKSVSYWKEREKNILKKQVCKMTLDSIIKGLGEKKGKLHRRQFIKYLRDYLLLHPDSISAVKEFLADKNINDKLASAIIHAMQLCGTPDAQLALTGVAENMLYKKSLRFMALISLGTIENPTESTVKSMWNISLSREEELSSQVSDTALLALGNMGFFQVNKKPSVSEEIKKGLSSRYDEARDTAEEVILLSSMGNTRNEELVPDIVTGFESDSSDVRSASAYALRHMNDESSLHKMADMLKIEDITGVRKSIVKSMLQREPDNKSITAVKSLVSKEKDSETRYAMYQYFVKNRKKYPNVKETLKKSLEHETSKSARILIYRGLYSDKEVVK